MQNITTNVNNNVYNDNDTAVLDVYDTPYNPRAQTNAGNSFFLFKWLSFNIHVPQVVYWLVKFV